MILVDIEILTLNSRFDFKLDENIYIADLVEKLAEMIVTKGDAIGEKQRENMMLCDWEKKRILPFDRTLDECGIGSGRHLVFL